MAAPLSLNQVTINGGFWGARLDTNRAATLWIEYEQLKQTGRIDAFRLDWKPGQSPKPHYFWDSDVAKWIEAGAYSLATYPDARLEALLDEVIDLIAQAQQPDGYLNIYFTVVEPGKRWTNLRDWHELYCAGHLIEAAVAYFQATGKRVLLDVMCRYADHIAATFGPAEGQKRGYPGHEEIELALVKLYRVTGEARYLRLAQFFVNERGQQPHYYDLEARQRGEDPASYFFRSYRYSQSHLPIREQSEIVGHAVRACYFYAGVADVAAETGDQTLVDACKRLWQHLTTRQMYITGGIGQVHRNEGFTFDYDLPDETAYAETCAAIALVFWAHRMLHLEMDGEYADVIERALYNGILSGVSLDGSHFFYANPLAAVPGVEPLHGAGGSDVPPYRRSEWFDCACCPPNLARLLAGLGQYLYSAGDGAVYVHLYAASTANLELNGLPVRVEQETDYPWGETVRFTVQPARPARFTLALRAPGWCRSPMLRVNGAALDVNPLLERGYARIDRVWEPGDQVEWVLPMPVERIEAHPRVRQTAGRVALMRGPVVYCLEEVDNGPDLAQVALPRAADLAVSFDPGLLGGVAVITGDALRPSRADWGNALYRPARPGALEPFRFKAIPYCLWANREPGEMRVWIRAQDM